MLVVTAALQVSEQIKDAGAYAGLASILGLAVLSLLYFGQARELKRLRDWAGRAPERTADLQEQADAAAAVRARRVVAQPMVAPAVRSPAQTPATAAGAAARPAGSVTAGAAATPAAAPGATAPGATATPGPTAPGAPATAAPGVAGAAGAGTLGSPAAPNAAAANGAPAPASRGQETQSIPAVGSPPPTPAAAKPLSPVAAPSPPASRPPAVPSVVAPTPIGPSPPPAHDSPMPLRQVSAATGVPRRRAGAEPIAVDQEDAGGPSGRTIAIVIGVTTTLLLVAVLATQLVGGGDDSATKRSARTTPTSTDNTFVAPSSTRGTETATPAADPSDYTVFVLNGTQRNGIAAEVGKTLETDGFVIADKGNAAVNSVPTTEVFYLEGQKRGASAIAKKLGVSAENVKRADSAISVQGPGADVIVQIGADKATP